MNCKCIIFPLEMRLETMIWEIRPYYVFHATKKFISEYSALPLDRTQMLKSSRASRTINFLRSRSQIRLAIYSF